MARRQWLWMFVSGLAAAMFGGRLLAQGKGKGKGGKGGKGDHIPGKRWEYTVTKNGMVVESGTFRWLMLPHIC